MKRTSGFWDRPNEEHQHFFENAPVKFASSSTASVPMQSTRPSPTWWPGFLSVNRPVPKQSASYVIQEIRDVRRNDPVLEVLAILGQKEDGAPVWWTWAKFEQELQQHECRVPGDVIQKCRSYQEQMASQNVVSQPRVTEAKESHKLVVLGDACVGKTALITQMCLNRVDELSSPTVEAWYEKLVQIDRRPCTLQILDTAGQDDFTILEDRWIETGDGFVIVYDVSSLESFARVQEYSNKIQQIKGSGPSLPGRPKGCSLFILIGNKCDLQREVPKAHGINLARRLGCEFIETSAVECMRVEEAFHDLVRSLRNYQKLQVQSGRPQLITSDHTDAIFCSVCSIM